MKSRAEISKALADLGYSSRVGKMKHYPRKDVWTVVRVSDGRRMMSGQYQERVEMFIEAEVI